MHGRAPLLSFRSGCIFGPFLGLFACICPQPRAVLALRLSAVLCPVADYSRGFGGKYGVQKDRMDKVSVPVQLPSAVGGSAHRASCGPVIADVPAFTSGGCQADSPVPLTAVLSSSPCLVWGPHQAGLVVRGWAAVATETFRLEGQC